MNQQHVFESHALADDAANGVLAVKAASKACMAVQAALADSEVVTKEDDSPVTVADYAAQAIVAWVLQRSCEGRLQLVAEEDSEDLRQPEGAAMLKRITSLVDETLRKVFPGCSGVSADDVIHLIDLGNSAGGASGKHWVLDPIDGTIGFAKMRQYAVCLGLLVDGEPTFGCLGCPNLPIGPMTEEDTEPHTDAGTLRDGYGVVFAALKGAGAYQGPLNTPGMPSNPVAVEPASPASEAVYMESYESRHSDHSLTDSIAKGLGITKPSLKLDSQCKYGLLSRAEAQLFMRFPRAGYREKIWDHAAGVVIAEEAGVRISDAKGQPLDFSLGRWLDTMEGGIIAAPPALHEQLVKLLKDSDYSFHI